MVKTIWNKDKKVVKKKAKTRGRYVKELDARFSRFIRLRDADKDGICSCITCGVKLPRNEMNNCHYISRGNYRYRRDENNCHAGCNSCNTYHQEMHMRHYSYYMIAKYGLETVMLMEAEKRTNTRRKLFELQDMIDFYKAKVKAHPLYAN